MMSCNLKTKCNGSKCRLEGTRSPVSEVRSGYKATGALGRRKYKLNNKYINRSVTSHKLEE